ncbi:hypothetical protein MKX07_004380 [Trichoderma sp. CBMAI-0711]|nr:hypothetical protein MKX07_004380 [Trichoderma sp. CBMAI-0711]
MPPQPPGPTHRSQRLDGEIRHKDGQRARRRLEQAALLGTDLPQHEQWHARGGEDLARERVERDDERRPGVADGEERDEGAVPLDAGQDGLVARLEEVEVAEDGEHDGADGLTAELVEVDDFREAEHLPHHEGEGAGAHGLGDEDAGGEEVERQEQVAGAHGVAVAQDGDELARLGGRGEDGDVGRGPRERGRAGDEGEGEDDLGEVDARGLEGALGDLVGEPAAVAGGVNGPVEGGEEEAAAEEVSDPRRREALVRLGRHQERPDDVGQDDEDGKGDDELPGRRGGGRDGCVVRGGAVGHLLLAAELRVRRQPPNDNEGDGVVDGHCAIHLGLDAQRGHERGESKRGNEEEQDGVLPDGVTVGGKADGVAQREKNRQPAPERARQGVEQRLARGGQRRDDARNQQRDDEGGEPIQRLLAVQPHGDQDADDEQHPRVRESAHELLVKVLVRMHLLVLVLEVHQLQPPFGVVELGIVGHDKLVVCRPRRVHDEHHKANGGDKHARDHPRDVKPSPQPLVHLESLHLKLRQRMVGVLVAQPSSIGQRPQSSGRARLLRLPNATGLEVGLPVSLNPRGRKPRNGGEVSPVVALAARKGLFDGLAKVVERYGDAQQQREGRHQINLVDGSNLGIRRRNCKLGRRPPEKRPLRVHPQSGLDLVVALSPMIPLSVHAVVAHDNQQRVVVDGCRHLGDEVVHLLQLGRHGGVIRAVSVSRMVHAQAVPDQEIPLTVTRRLQQRKDVVHDAVVDSVQVPDVEAVVRLADVGLEVVRKQGPPGVVSQMGNLLPGIPQLHQQIVLVNGRPGKVAPGIDKRGQRARRQALEPLQRRRRRIRNERPQERILRRLDGRVVQEGQRIVKGMRRRRILGNGKVVAQRIDQNHHGAVKLPRMPATPGHVQRRPRRQRRRRFDRRRRAARLVLKHQPRQQEAAGKQPDAHAVHRQQPRPKGRRPPPSPLVRPFAAGVEPLALPLENLRLLFLRRQALLDGLCVPGLAGLSGCFCLGELLRDGPVVEAVGRLGAALRHGCGIQWMPQPRFWFQSLGARSRRQDAGHWPPLEVPRRR